MIWNDLPLESVITRNLFYFDESKKDTCERICKKLEIDCFPDLSKNIFWIFEDDVWKPNEIKPNEIKTLAEIYNPFDEKLLKLYDSNHSNIVFVSSNSMVDGIIHFTNYENETVFSNLYRNFHVFEKHLRSHLISLDLNFEYLKNYFEKKQSDSIKENDKRYYQKKLDRFKSDEFNEKNPYQELDFGDLLNFTVSDEHDIVTLNKIDIIKLKIEDKKILDEITELRNQIMHHKQVSGENKYSLHNFFAFEKFFLRVLKFKKAFFSLSKTFADNTLDNKKIINSKKLELIGQMSNSEIKEYFYTNY